MHMYHCRKGKAFPHGMRQSRHSGCQVINCGAQQPVILLVSCILFEGSVLPGELGENASNFAFGGVSAARNENLKNLLYVLDNP